MWTLSGGGLAQGLSQTFSEGETVQISQSVQPCVSSESLKPPASMCTSAGLTTCPSTDGSVMVGAAGGSAWATPPPAISAVATPNPTIFRQLRNTASLRTRGC